MVAPQTLILRAPGTNCDLETEHAFQLAGARTLRIHINRLVQSKNLLNESQMLCIPGGFSYGDDIAAGRILAARLIHHLGDRLLDFRDRGGLVLGICNGFQVLLQIPGLVTGQTDSRPAVSLAHNGSGRFETRWVHLRAGKTKSIFLQGIERLYLPVAHAEGRLAAGSAQVLSNLIANDQVALRYCGPPGEDNRLSYPDNPNGSLDDIAAINDQSGQVLGLMPHPERYVHRLQHPRWTRGEGQEQGDGLQIFRNAVQQCTAS
jgi:phosphoribosylformylglycinamidine synthase